MTDIVEEDASLEPNPASGSVTLRYLLSDEATASVQVYDIMGRCVLGKKTLPLYSNQELLDISSLEPAVYIVKFMSNIGFKKELKLIVSK
jgi:hypothetical protein